MFLRYSGFRIAFTDVDIKLGVVFVTDCWIISKRVFTSVVSKGIFYAGQLAFSQSAKLEIILFCGWRGFTVN